jgi:crooked neck
VIISVYKRATANTPPTTQDKRLWKRYVFLYLNWAVFAEKIGQDAAPIYEEIIKKIPHS